jgi:type III secretion system YseE family protein
MAQPILMLKLEEELYADKSGKRRLELMRQLQGMQGRLQVELRQLHDRKVYQELQAALQAVSAALHVINTLRVC